MLLLEPPVQFPGAATCPPGSEWIVSGIGIDRWWFPNKHLRVQGFQVSISCGPLSPHLKTNNYYKVQNSWDMLPIQSDLNSSFTFLPNPSLKHVGISMYVGERARALTSALLAVISGASGDSGILPKIEAKKLLNATSASAPGFQTQITVE
jgi:hypothetical protein